MLQDGQEILEGRFQIIKKLGSGAFGEIYKGKCPPPNHSLTHSQNNDYTGVAEDFEFHVSTLFCRCYWSCTLLDQLSRLEKTRLLFFKWHHNFSLCWDKGSPDF